MNLLFLLAGLMISPLILNWRFAMSSIFFISVRRQVSQIVNAGQTCLVEMQTKNAHPRITSWSLKIRDRISQLVPGHAQQNGNVDVIVNQISPGDTVSTSYRCFFSQRGKYEIGPATISTSFPLGLVQSSYDNQEKSTVFVGPRLGTLTPVWHERLRSMAAGSQSNQRRRGIEQDEFYALRPWKSGDSQRWIHWRSTAKYQNLTVRQFDQQGDRDFAVVLDFWCPETNDGGANPIPLEITELAASGMATVVSEIDNWLKGQVITALCGDEVTALSGAPNSQLVAALMEKLAVIKASPQNGFVDALKDVSINVSKGTPIIVVSTRPRPEFPDADALLESALNRVDWVQAGTSDFDGLFHFEESVLREQLKDVFESNDGLQLMDGI